MSEFLSGHDRTASDSIAVDFNALVIPSQFWYLQVSLIHSVTPHHATANLNNYCILTETRNEFFDLIGSVQKRTDWRMDRVTHWHSMQTTL